MLFILIGTTALGITGLLYLWRCIAERGYRWQLYALRDELRWIAISNPGIAESEVFEVLDHNLTFLASRLQLLSLWSMVPILVSSQPGEIARINDRQRRMMDQLRKPEFSGVAKIYERSTWIVAKHFALQHPLVSTIAGVTIIGGVGVYQFAKWASERIVSNAYSPIEIRIGRSAIAA